MICPIFELEKKIGENYVVKVDSEYLTQSLNYIEKKIRENYVVKVDSNCLTQSLNWIRKLGKIT